MSIPPVVPQPQHHHTYPMPGSAERPDRVWTARCHDWVATGTQQETLTARDAHEDAAAAVVAAYWGAA